VPRVLIGLVHRIIGGLSNAFRVVLQRPPEVRHHAIEVIDRFSFGRPWTL
jgi:hypothetical protein